jgi:exonuclease III
MSAERGRPGGRHAGGLRIATHNVRGLRGSAAQLVQLWLAVLSLDVVLIQETKLARRDSVLGVVASIELAARLAAEDADRPPLRFFWAHGPTQHHGVAIAIRSDLIDSGRIKVVGRPSAAVDGRLLSLKVEWRGHSLMLASAYLPSGDDKGQRAFITERLAPLAAGARGGLVLGGDFNFTPDPRGLDRRRRAGGAQPRRAPECVTAGVMAGVCRASGLADVFRARHPHRRVFTYYSTAGNAAASRLDRFYVPEALLPHVMQCQAEVSPPGCSDHRPVVLHLSPAAPEKVGPGLRRLRVRFLDDPALRQEFAAWLEAEEAVARQPVPTYSTGGRVLSCG